MLWNIGSIYVIILLVILVAGMGMGIFKLLETTGEVLVAGNDSKHPKNGGAKNNRVGMLGYAAMAFTAVIVAYFTVGLLAVNGSEQSHDHAAHVAQQTSSSQQPTNVQFSTQPAQHYQTIDSQLSTIDRELGVMEHNFNYQGY